MPCHSCLAFFCGIFFEEGRPHAYETALNRVPFMAGAFCSPTAHRLLTVRALVDGRLALEPLLPTSLAAVLPGGMPLPARVEP